MELNGNHMRSFLKKLYKAIPLKKYFFNNQGCFWFAEENYKHLYFKGLFKVNIDKHSFHVNHYGYQIENEIIWKGLLGGREKGSMKL